MGSFDRTRHPDLRRRREIRVTAWQRSTACLALALSSLVATGVQAAPVCGLDGLVPFAGHNLPLDGPPQPTSWSAVDAFPSLPSFSTPVFLTGAGDGTNRLFVVEQSGRILVFPNDPNADAGDVDVYLDLTNVVDYSQNGETGLLGLAFDPEFATNGRLYVNYTGFLRTFIERITVPDPTANQIDLAATQRLVLFEFQQANVNHNGGMLAFGPDGMLYVASGDGGGSSSAAADLSNPLGTILRIDPEDGSAPPDNPFVSTSGAEPRIAHYGLRNPWRFSFDRAAPHELWIGDVGQDDWEEIDRVAASTRGLDFGWPACEGAHNLGSSSNLCSSPTSTLPVLELGRADAGSITGGYVYRGTRLPQLYGTYVFGDFVTGKVWGWDRLTVDPTTGLGVKVQLASVANLSSFGEDDAGELYLLDYPSGRILELEPGSGGGSVFPPLLSGTGLFSDTAALVPAPGVVEYDVASPLWSDRALKRRFIALPAGARIATSLTGAWAPPLGTVLIKQFDLPIAPGQVRRVETRLYIHQLPGWLGITYRWTDQQDDAELLATGFSETFTIDDGSQVFEQTWDYPSSSGCNGCHTAAAGRVLGVRTAQLNRPFDYPAGSDGQLHAWSCGGLLDTDFGSQTGLPAHVPLDDAAATRQQRARSYLDSNCAMCHQPGGPAPGGMDLRKQGLLGQLNLIGVAPTQGGLGLPSPERIKPGASDESVLFARMSSTDPSLRMARGTRLAHDEALDVFRDWIDFDLLVVDSDEDGVPDATDLCPGTADPLQSDRDADGVGDLCDPDDAPDLVAAAFGAAETYAGANVSLAALLDNLGLTPGMSSQARFFLSEDAVYDAGSDVSVGTCQTWPVQPGTRSVCIDAAHVPIDILAPGDPDPKPFYWIACADGLDVVAETDEQNNCAVATAVVMVPEPDWHWSQSSGLLGLLAISYWDRRRRCRARPV